MPRKNYVDQSSGLVGFGPDANCTLSTCDLAYSAYEYRPSLAASGIFIAIFALSGLLHLAQGAYAARSQRHSRQWFYSIAMAIGCLCEIIGYAGRVMLWDNPFSFDAFLMQIITITFAPAFFSAAIYITTGQIARAFGQSRLKPSAYAWIFITCDIISLTLQAAGGGLSTGSAGLDGVHVSIAGLAFQVFSLLVFILFTVDYYLHYRRARRAGVVQSMQPPRRFKLFVYLIGAAVILILARCAYRIAELSEGYQGSIFVDQAGFIVLEGVFMSIATLILNAANPLRVFDKQGSLIGGASNAETQITNEKEFEDA